LAPREEKRGSKFALSFYKTVILMSTGPSFSELSRKP
jgi:CPSaseII_lrg: carbamoyl-phosphate synthase, large subunit